MSGLIRRAALVGLFGLGVAGCAQSQSVPTVGATAASPSITSTPSVGPAPSTLAPSPVASAPPPEDHLAWIAQPGIDIRGAVVATGTQSASTSLLLGADDATGGLMAWTSTGDGPWQRHWLDGSSFGGGMPRAVAAGGPGFVALAWDIDSDLATNTAVWTSPDGVAWTADPDSSGRFATDRVAIAATSSSVVISTCCDTSGTFGRPILWTSTDGVVWTATTLPVADNAGPIHLAATAAGYLAVSLVPDPAGVEELALASWRSADGRTWRRDEVLDANLRSRAAGINDVLATGDTFMIADDANGYFSVGADGSVSSIDRPAPYVTPIGGPAGILWLGGADAGVCLSAISDRHGRSEAIPSDPGGCAISTEAGVTVPVDDGWLVVAPREAEPLADSMWAIRPSDSTAEGVAPVGPAPAPPSFAIPTPPIGPLTARVPCPVGPVTIERIIALDGNDRVACFHSRDLTFRAWVVDPGKGYGGTCPAVVPRWLLDCVLPDWLLALDQASDLRLRALRHPGATGTLKGVGRWVDVTGHFDDPAATTCRMEAGPAVVGYPPVGWFVLTCREQFVVTDIKTVR